ncbi:PDK repeat-containing protein [Owenweeksia hongkongensis DSM 17368]|uniref:PDK repeat-containing protein n=1 Tax=Owenweeksia hongkongensis (strain DSM 17368 / CIP 108786 / JCM 12287 / NRRL B-23963 / UST20020801) TaxID=926562 RepID=G8R3M6_OWEHD|nr:T9SS type A sorting domain-containing protein [Owenweeksia hongkongensis]AEV33082.1 PDK repeat-containing protein [Owenweeksia hongkongensis DSM 17368]
MKKLLLSLGLAVLLFALVVPFTKKDKHEKYAEFINNHEYSTREHLTPEQIKAIPKEDRPDLAMEQNFLLTLDPALGHPAPERLLSVYQQVSNARNNPIPGTPGASTNPWIERGPSNVGGRTRAIMFDPNDVTHKKVWVGSVTGGLWYNNDITNFNSNWIAVNDFWDNIAITAIAADPTNSSTFYVATGEGWGTGSSRGAGVWKTTDAGNTWTHLPSTSSFYYINDLVVREENGNGTIYAAVQGMSYNSQFHGIADEGLQRSIDGGQTFTQVLPNVGSGPYAPADIEIAANNSIWVGTTNSFRSVIPQGGGKVFYSNNGTSWAVSYSQSGGERVELACAPSDSNYVYALIESSNQVEAIVKTTDYGTNWTNVSEPDDADRGIDSDDFSRGQAWYDLTLAVDPNDPDVVFTGAIDLFKTTNGGNNWDQISHWYGGFGYPDVHADQHVIVFKPGSSSEVLFGNDGGLYRSTNAQSFSPSFTNLNRGYNVTQFYAGAIHPSSGTNYFLAGAQDNGSQQFTSAGINSTNEVTGGDGGYCFIDQTNPQIQVTSYVYNSYWRSTDGGASFSSRIQNETTGSFINPTDYDDNLHILYSNLSGASINRILDMDGNPDISPFRAFIGSPATHLRVSPYTTTSTTLFVGTTAGRVYKITNADGSSPTLTNITTSDLPIGSVSCIEIGSSENELLVTYSNYGVNSVWYTNDGGANWTSKEGDLPDMPVRWSLFNPNNRNEVLLATEVGVWRCSNINSPNPSWTPSTSGLANVRTSMLQMRDSDNEVIAATYGRGLFSSSAFSSISSPDADFTPSSNPVCGNSPITLSDHSSSAPTSWQWTITPNTYSFVNGTSASSTNPQVLFNTSGNYKVKLVVTNTMGSDSSIQNITAGVYSPPVITALDDQLFCSSRGAGLTYQWYENGVLIPNANWYVINITNNAVYTVTVSSSSCSETSPPFDLQNIGLNDLATEAGIKIYPNPLTDKLNVQLPNPSGENGSIRIFNMQGKVVFQKNTEASKIVEETISLGHLPKGQYLIKINIGNQSYSKSISKA